MLDGEAAGGRGAALGVNDLTLAKWRAFFALRQEFDEAVGTSIYTLLPGVVEEHFRLLS